MYKTFIITHSEVITFPLKRLFNMHAPSELAEPRESHKSQPHCDLPVLTSTVSLLYDVLTQASAKLSQIKKNDPSNWPSVRTGAPPAILGPMKRYHIVPYHHRPRQHCSNAVTTPREPNLKTLPLENCNSLEVL